MISRLPPLLPPVPSPAAPLAEGTRQQQATQAAVGGEGGRGGEGGHGRQSVGDERAGEEAGRAMKLMCNKRLMALRTELVVEIGVLSEAEFWEAFDAGGGLGSTGRRQPAAVPSTIPSVTDVVRTNTEVKVNLDAAQVTTRNPARRRTAAQSCILTVSFNSGNSVIILIASSFR